MPANVVAVMGSANSHGMQVQANMWIRNGPEVVQLQHVYQSPYWSDTSLTLDLLSLQLWLAHAGCNE